MGQPGWPGSAPSSFDYLGWSSLLLEEVSESLSSSKGVARVHRRLQGGESVQSAVLLSKLLEGQVSGLLSGDEHGAKGGAHPWAPIDLGHLIRRIHR